MSTINSYFSQKDNLQEIIISKLDKAQMVVKVAVAWLTDTVLFNKLVEIQKKGVEIELIITKHQFNDDSNNDYSILKNNGGIFLQIGGDYRTMHHKFCIVDHKILLQGSFNWTRKANESNNETLLVIEDDYLSINEFSEEFERLKRFAGLEKELKELEIASALKYFNLIRSFIELGKTNDIYPYVQEIKDIHELTHVVNFLNAGEYEKAVVAMEEFQRNYTALVDISKIEKEELIFKIRLFSEEIRQLEIEKTSIEDTIETFNRRCILELNPLIALIINLKRKILEKLKIKDETFEELSDQYKNVNDELAKEQEKEVIELTEEEKIDIKKMYHGAAVLCHPDSAQCVIEDKAKSEEIFQALSIAYKAKDIETVKRIYDELKTGTYNIQNLNNTEIEVLRRRLSILNNKYNLLLSLIKTIKITEPFLTIQRISNWDEYFEIQKSELLKQKNDLELNFVKS